VHDSQAEGIVIGGEGSAVEACTVERAAGNGIHLTGANGVRIVNNYIRHTNLAGGSIGHVDGNISFSVNFGPIMVTGNYLEDGLAGLGGGGYPSFNNVTVANNVIKNARSHAFEGRFHNSIAANILIENNQILDCGSVIFEENQGDSDTNRICNVIVANNFFQNTNVRLLRTRAISVYQNHILCSSNVHVAIEISNGSQVAIDGNYITGGSYGVYLSGTNNIGTRIANNVLSDQRIQGVRVAGAGVGVSITDNTITCSASQETARYYSALHVSHGALVRGNNIMLQQGLYGIVCPWGDPGTNITYVVQNFIVTSPGTKSIVLFSSAAKNVVIGNLYNQEMRNDATAEANRVDGNILMVP
jgi:hypothetical protein